MTYIKLGLLLLTLCGFVQAYASEDTTEAVAISGGHQAGITRGGAVNNDPDVPFGGYKNERRSDKQTADQMILEYFGRKSTSEASKATD